VAEAAGFLLFRGLRLVPGAGAACPACNAVFAFAVVRQLHLVACAALRSVNDSGPAMAGIRIVPMAIRAAHLLSEMRAFLPVLDDAGSIFFMTLKAGVYGIGRDRGTHKKKQHRGQVKKIHWVSSDFIRIAVRLS
jgi:hypothetical protein